MNPLPGLANFIKATMVAKATAGPWAAGDPLTGGNGVYFYLCALSSVPGAYDDGRWFNPARLQTPEATPGAWDTEEAVAGLGTHVGGGNWTASLPGAAWIDGMDYLMYAADADGLSVAYSELLHCSGPLATAAELAAVKAKAELIGSTVLLATGRAGTSPRLIIQAGDSYLAADGTGLVVTITGYAGPDVDDCAGVVRLVTTSAWRDGATDEAELELACTLSQSGTTVTARFDMTAEESAGLPIPLPISEPDNFRFQVLATLGGSTVTVGGVGPCSVRRGIAPQAGGST